MFHKQHGEWHWGSEPLGLAKLEAALLDAMLRAPGSQRRAHIWLAWEMGLPCSPVIGKACIFTLRRKLDTVGIPPGTLLGDATSGVMLATSLAPRRAWSSRSAYPSPPNSLRASQPLHLSVLLPG